MFSKTLCSEGEYELVLSLGRAPDCHHDFLAPFEIRADQFAYLGVRLPYAKFPRDPTSNPPVGPPPFIPPAEMLGNISTRVIAGTENNQLIGGFIISGEQPKRVIVRAIGPSLGPLGIPSVLADPILELHEAAPNFIFQARHWDRSVERPLRCKPPANSTAR